VKNILILLIIIGAGYQGWKTMSHSSANSEPLHEEPYVVVYGRNSCGITQQTMNDLKAAGIPFEYQIVDDKSVASLLHSRMQQSGIDTRRYNLPVVDVSNRLSVRPEASSIIEAFND
jgi:hypothetical protein